MAKPQSDHGPVGVDPHMPFLACFSAAGDYRTAPAMQCRQAASSHARPPSLGIHWSLAVGKVPNSYRAKQEVNTSADGLAPRKTGRKAAACGSCGNAADCVQWISRSREPMSALFACRFLKTPASKWRRPSLPSPRRLRLSAGPAAFVSCAGPVQAGASAAASVRSTSDTSARRQSSRHSRIGVGGGG